AADLERGLRVRALATGGEVLRADLVDLGRQRALAEASSKTADERVEVLERQVTSRDRGRCVQLRRLQRDRAVVGDLERVVERAGRVARADVDEILQVELLGVCHERAHGRQAVALAFAFDAELVVLLRGAGGGESEEGREGCGAELHGCTPLFAPGVPPQPAGNTVR